MMEERLMPITNEAAKYCIENTLKANGSSIFDRNKFRNQIKILAITLFLTLVGFIFSSRIDIEYKIGIYLLAVFLDIGLYCMDTALLELIQREEKYGKKLNNYLLHWKSMKENDVESAISYTLNGAAVERFNENGKELSTLYRKIRLAFTFRLNDFFWYFIPIFGSFLIGIIVIFLKVIHFFLLIICNHSVINYFH
jgi:hypothetical protein